MKRSIGSVELGGAKSSDGRDMGLVGVKDGAGNGVLASNYDADKTAGTTSIAEALPTSAQSLEVVNTHATAVVRFRFGSDNTVVATATTGFIVAPGEKVAVPIAANTSAGNTPYWAYISDTASTTLAVVVGG